LTETDVFCHSKAVRYKLFEWRQTADDISSETIVLDLFSRNTVRNPVLSLYWAAER